MCLMQIQNYKFTLLQLNIACKSHKLKVSKTILSTGKSIMTIGFEKLFEKSIKNRKNKYQNEIV